MNVLLLFDKEKGATKEKGGKKKSVVQGTFYYMPETADAEDKTKTSTTARSQITFQCQFKS